MARCVEASSRHAHTPRIYRWADDAERNLARATVLTACLDHEVGAAGLQTLLELYALFATSHRAFGPGPCELDEVPTADRPRPRAADAEAGDALVLALDVDAISRCGGDRGGGAGPWGAAASKKPGSPT